MKSISNHSTSQPILANIPEELQGPWNELRPFISATPGLQSFLYDLDLMPEQIYNARNFFRMLQISEFAKIVAVERDELKALNAELLEVCKTAVTYSDAHREDGQPVRREYLGKMRALIAKAEAA